MAMSNQSQYSTGSSGSGSSRSKNERQVLCYHDEVAPLRVVKFNGPTAGKRFYGTSYWPVSMVDAIFLNEQQYARGESEKTEEIISKQEDQIQKLAIENTEMREGLFSAKSDRTLALALV
ncbi:Tubulin alpha-1B chain, partial [Bienertia sinuspersici]